MTPEEFFINMQKTLNVQNQLLSQLLKLEEQKVVDKKLKEKKQEILLGNDFVVTANSSQERQEVNNPGFNRCRVFLDAAFTPAHTGGIVVKMVYKNNPMSDVLHIISSNGSAGAVSDPINIEQLSGFSLEVRNQDSSNDTTVRNFKVVLYNKMD